MKCQMVNIHSYLKNRGVALWVNFVASVRLDDEFEAIVRLARENVTKSVGVGGSVTNDSELPVIESGAFSLQYCASRIKGTHRYGKLFIVESAINDNGAINLQHLASWTTQSLRLKHITSDSVGSALGTIGRVETASIGEGELHDL